MSEDFATWLLETQGTGRGSLMGPYIVSHANWEYGPFQIRGADSYMTRWQLTVFEYGGRVADYPDDETPQFLLAGVRGLPECD